MEPGTTQLNTALVAAFVGVIAVTTLVLKLFSRGLLRLGKRLPPGPKGYPIIGTLLDYPGPTEQGWLLYDEWFKQYGDMVYFEVVGQPFLVLGSLERVYDLMEKRSSNYSDRPISTMMFDLMGWRIIFGLHGYGQHWRDGRRWFHRHFNVRETQKYRDIQLDEARKFAIRLADRASDAPRSNLEKHIRRVFAGTIMRISYGIPVESDDSEYIQRAEIAFEGIARAGVPGAFLVDLLPVMKYIPSWFPGAGWKRQAEYWRKITDMIIDVPFGVVVKQRAKGTAPPSVALSLIESLPPKDDPRYIDEVYHAKGTPAAAYVAGSDTTTSSVQALFLALAVNPDVVRKAQEEIDRVVGPGRLPDFDDEPHLHYVKAICKEIIRWHNVTPLGLAHMATEADEYNGYYIPKGTIVMASSWSILHDHKVYEDPFAFKPERFIKDGKFDVQALDPKVAGAFGFGRRGCPGRNVAENSLYAIASTLLAAFNILPPLDNAGNPKQLIYEVTGGMVSYPKPFEVRVEPRNYHADQLIRGYISPLE